MSNIELESGESKLGSWTLNYKPPGGGRYTGKLVVTNARVLFDAQFDTSMTGAFKELLIMSGSHGYLSIPKSSIQSTDVKSSFFKKTVTVTLGDNTAHTFDYGMLSVKKVAAAIQARSPQ